MRILVLTNQFPPHSLGGYALSCQSVVEYLRQRGHCVYVLTSDARLADVADGDDRAGEDVHRDLYLWFRDLGRSEPKVPNPPLTDRFRYERHNQRTLGRVLAGWRPDVVSVWEMGAMSLSTLTLVERAGVPMVLTLHDYWPEYAPQWDPWLRLIERRPVLKRVLAPLKMVTAWPDLSLTSANVVSHSLLEDLAGRGRWQFPGAQVIPWGVDRRVFPDPEPEPQPRDWTWKVLYVGRLDSAKGLRTLALAMRYLPAEASLEVLGKGDPEMTAMVSDLIGQGGGDGRVRFSSCPRAELAERYRAADVVVFPSEWEEPFGLVPLEAMACGTPVVATGTGGSREYLRDGENCLLFPPGDPAGLAAAVQRLAGDPQIRRKLLVEGARTADAYSFERAAADIERLHLAAAGIEVEPAQ